MKKVIFISIFLIVSGFMIFGQEDSDQNSLEETEINQEEFSDASESEDFSDFDDFDSIFEDAEDLDEAVVEEKENKTSTPIQVIASAFSSMVRL